MQDIPYKTTEAVSSEYLLVLLFIIVLLAIGMAYLVRFLKNSNLPMFSYQKKDSSIKVIQTAQISNSSKVILLSIDGEKIVVTESNKHVEVRVLGDEKDSTRKEIDKNSQVVIKGNDEQ